MYDFNYNRLSNVRGLELHYIDTGSFVLSYANTEENKQEFIRLSDEFDYSNLDPTDPRYKTKNKKVVGKFKIETGSKKIEEFIALKAKCYYVKVFDDEDIKKEKGINKDIVKGYTFEDYRNALIEGESRDVVNPSIRSFKHKLYTISTLKNSLSRCDDKRFYVNNIVSYPHDDKHELFRRDVAEGMKEKFENGELSLKTIREIFAREELEEIEKLIEIYNLCFPSIY